MMDVERARAEVAREVGGVVRAWGFGSREAAPVVLCAHPPGYGKTRAAREAVVELVCGRDPWEALERPVGFLVVWVGRTRAAVVECVQAARAAGAVADQAVYLLGRDGSPGAPLGVQARGAGGDVASCSNVQALHAARLGVRVDGVCGPKCPAWGPCNGPGWSYGTAGGFARAKRAALGASTVASALLVTTPALVPAVLDYVREALTLPRPPAVLWVWDDVGPSAFLVSRAPVSEVLRALGELAPLTPLPSTAAEASAAALDHPSGARLELPALPQALRGRVKARVRVDWSEAELVSGKAFGRGVADALRAWAEGEPLELLASPAGGVEVVHRPRLLWTGAGEHVVLSSTDPAALWGFLGPVEVLGAGMLAQHGARVEVVLHEDCAGRVRLDHLQPKRALGVARTLAQEWGGRLAPRRDKLLLGAGGVFRVLLLGPRGFLGVEGVVDAFAATLGRVVGVAVEVEPVHWGAVDATGSNRFETWDAAAALVLPRSNPHAVHLDLGFTLAQVEAERGRVEAVEAERAAGELLQGVGRLRIWTRPGVEVAVAVGRRGGVPRALARLEGPPLELAPVAELARVQAELGVAAPVEARRGRPPARHGAELARLLEGWPAWSTALDRALGVGSGALARFLAEPSNFPPGWTTVRRAATGARGRSPVWTGPSEGAIIEAAARLAGVDPGRVNLTRLDGAEGELDLDPDAQAQPPTLHAAPSEVAELAPPVAELWGAAGGSLGRARLEARVGSEALAQAEAEALARGARWTSADVAALARGGSRPVAS